MKYLDRNPLKRSFNASELKLIAIVTMLIDHIGAIIITNLMNMAEADSLSHSILTVVNELCRSIGRMAFLIFCFFIATGYIYTHNKWKYLTRLVLFGIISEIPFDLATKGTLFNPGYQNVYFTLILGLLAIMGRSFVKRKNLSKPVFTPLRYVAYYLFGLMTFLMLITSSNLSMIFRSRLQIFISPVVLLGKTRTFYNMNFLIAGSVCGLISILVFSIICRKKTSEAINKEAVSWLIPLLCMFIAEFISCDYRSKGVLVIVVIYAFLENGKDNFKSLLAGIITISIFNISELAAMLDLFVMDNYNGEKGKGNKYLFYIFYPAHLLILGLIAHFCF